MKKDIYESTFHTADYFIYDPFDPNSLQGWHLDNTQHYQPTPANDSGWLWYETLGLWLGNWEGSIRREPPTGTCHWLRFYDSEGQVVLLPEEIAQQQTQRAEQERLRAEQAEQQREHPNASKNTLGVGAGELPCVKEAGFSARTTNLHATGCSQQQTARLMAHLRAQGIDPDELLSSST